MTYIKVSFFLAIIGFSNMPLVFEGSIYQSAGSSPQDLIVIDAVPASYFVSPTVYSELRRNVEECSMMH